LLIQACLVVLLLLLLLRRTAIITGSMVMPSTVWEQAQATFLHLPPNLCH